MYWYVVACCFCCCLCVCVCVCVNVCYIYIYLVGGVFRCNIMNGFIIFLLSLILPTTLCIINTQIYNNMPMSYQLYIGQCNMLSGGQFKYGMVYSIHYYTHI